MVVALLFRVGEGLAAAAVHTFRGHGGVFVVGMAPDIGLLRCLAAINQSINWRGLDKTASTSYVSRAVSNGRTRETGVSLGWNIQERSFSAPHNNLSR